MTFIAALRCDRIDAPFVFDQPINAASFTYPSAERHLPFLVKPLSLVLMDDLKVAHKYGGTDGA